MVKTKAGIVERGNSYYLNLPKDIRESMPDIENVDNMFLDIEETNLNDTKRIVATFGRDKDES